MPIVKVPIVHKFGIISHSQRIELQERLLKQSYLDAIASKKSDSSYLLEVTEEFVQEFNEAESFDAKDKYEVQAYKMLERIKRKSGLKDGGTGNHVDLPVAWTELSQLAQCKGKIQEECLDVLILSLDSAPMDKSQIPALFYMAETTLYWLRTDSIHQPYLRTNELKLLHMGLLTFLRLYYHYMSGHLKGHFEFKNRLFTYLDGFGDCQEAYSPFPNALLSIRFINTVGKMIIGDAYTEAGEIKEGDPVYGNLTNKNNSGYEYSMYPNDQETDSKSRQSVSGLSSSVHELSPTLWHALDVWRCVNHLSGGLPDALYALSCCGGGLCTESWVDAVCAMHILGDASKMNLQTLKVLQGLAKGIEVHRSASTLPQTQNEGEAYGETEEYRSKTTFEKPVLSDIFEQSDENTNFSAKPSQRDLRSEDSRSESSTQRKGLPPGDSSMSKLAYMGPSDSSETAMTTGQRVEVGSAENSSERQTNSSEITYTNAVDSAYMGLQGWHWEVAVTYINILKNICLRGKSSQIQKQALVGNNKDTNNIHKVSGAECPMRSAGLIDLVFFKSKGAAKDGGKNDFSWRVRYAALQGLVQVSRSCDGDKTKDGLRTVSLNTLTKAQEIEKDMRVLEALKVGQVDATIEKMLNKYFKVMPTSIGCKIAQGLAAIYLPPLPPAVKTPVPKPKPKTTTKIISSKTPYERNPKRTALKDEIMLATTLYEPPVSINTRNDLDLKRIVEDQWRKELQRDLDEVEEERQEKLKERQEKEEKDLKEMEENKREKFNKNKTPVSNSNQKVNKDKKERSVDGKLKKKTSDKTSFPKISSSLTGKKC